MGHVRLAKDPQRLANMLRSKLAEISAISSIEKPIVTPEQIAGHQGMWVDDNLKNYPYLLINQLTDQNGNPAIVGPNAYTKSPQIPPAMAALLQLCEQDMQDLLGNQQAGEQLMPNQSGKAVELIQNRLDMQSFIYLSNFSKALRRSGEIWLDMAKDILVEEGRTMKGLTKTGEPEKIELLTPMLNDETGEVEYDNDLTEANFDVTVEVGPSSSSKRAATVRALTGMMAMATDPETAQVLQAMAMMNMEGEGISDVRDFFRMKMLRMGVVKPTDEEQQQLAQEMQNQQPDPNAQFLQASAEQASAEAVKARANSILSVAKAKEAEANTMATLAGMDTAHQELILKAAKLIQDQQSGNLPTA
jgi:hypothetical protein